MGQKERGNRESSYNRARSSRKGDESSREMMDPHKDDESGSGMTNSPSGKPAQNSLLQMLQG